MKDSNFLDGFFLFQLFSEIKYFFTTLFFLIKLFFESNLFLKVIFFVKDFIFQAWQFFIQNCSLFFQGFMIFWNISVAGFLANLAFFLNNFRINLKCRLGFLWKVKKNFVISFWNFRYFLLKIQLSQGDGNLSHKASGGNFKMDLCLYFFVLFLFHRGFIFCFISL